MKILLLGDTHGVGGSLARAINFVQAEGLDAVFQVGDFGYWPRSGTTRKSYIALAAESPVPVYWLPGNHEDWDDYEAVLEALDRDDDGFAIWGSMRISPKVHHWMWDGLKFGVLGGAYSVDRALRTLGESYFEQEIPEFSDVDKLPTEKLDILLTHEAPMNLAVAHGWGPLPKAWKVDWDLSNQSQNVIKAAMEKTQPDLLVHGHWHIRLDYWVPGFDTFCQCLDQASASDYDCMMVLDTERKALYDLYQYKTEGTRPQWQLES
jgi:Icc-related predicted phosphoesterase